MPSLDEIRAARLAQYGAPTNFADAIAKHIEWCVNNFQSASILIRVAEQNELEVRSKIVEYVAKIEGWEHTDASSYSSFEVAMNSLYLKHTILIRLQLKERSNPDYSFMDVDVQGFTKFFYDLELHTSDPYFGTITRGYYNEVNS